MSAARIIAALLLAAALFPAAAAEWVPVSRAGMADRYFFDASRLVIKGNEISYWKKVEFATPRPLAGGEAVTGLLRERIDCAEHTAQLISYLYYSASGETLEYVARYEGEPAPIIPDTVGDAFERTLCPRVWRKQEQERIQAEQQAAAAELARQKQREAEAAAPPAAPAPLPVPQIVPDPERRTPQPGVVE